MRDSIVGGGILGSGRMTTGVADALALTLGCTSSQIAIDVSFTPDPLTTYVPNIEHNEQTLSLCPANVLCNS